ncbi:MAG: hypothetical protein ACTTGJ_03955 [Clostridium sp.]
MGNIISEVKIDNLINSKIKSKNGITMILLIIIILVIIILLSITFESLIRKNDSNVIQNSNKVKREYTISVIEQVKKEIKQTEEIQNEKFTDFDNRVINKLKEQYGLEEKVENGQTYIYIVGDKLKKEEFDNLLE